MPAQRPTTPSFLITARTTSPMVLWGLSFDCRRVLTRSRGLVTAAAKPPLTLPATRLRSREM